MLIIDDMITGITLPFFKTRPCSMHDCNFFSFLFVVNGRNSFLALFSFRSVLPAYQITTSSTAKNSPFVEIKLVKDLASSLVTGGSIDAYRNHLKEKV